jgi:hypothetical protein
VFPDECKHDALGIDSTQYYVDSAANALLLVQVSVVVLCISHMGANFDLKFSRWGELAGLFYGRLVFDNDSGSSGPTVIVANLAILLEQRLYATP